MIKVINTVNYRAMSAVMFFLLLAVTYALAGPMGLALTTVATAIGLIPVYFHSRRMNCMGVLLLPITLNMGGLGPSVVRLMGLM
jgi:putative membrane protein